MLNLERIRVDPDGLIIQDKKGGLKRVALPRVDVDGVINIPEDTFKRLNIKYPARLDVIDEPYEGLNRPLRVYYGIEPRCNLHCPMCGPRDFHEGLKPASEETENFILQQIADANVFQVQLTGGEFEIRGARILETIQKSAELGLAVLLSTNGVWNCIDNKDDLLAKLVACGNIIQSKISIEGTPEFHDSIRGKGTYAQTIDTLAKLSEYGLNPRISTTVFKSSCNNEQLEHLVNLAKKYNAGFQPIPLRPIGQGYQMKDQAPSQEQLQAYTKRATQLRRETGIPITFNFDIYEPRGKVAAFDVHHPVSCSAPLWGLHITHTGEVYPCGFVQEADPHGSGGIKEPLFLAGKIGPETSLVSIWKNSKMLNEVREAGKSDVCNSCESYGNGCWGGCWVMSWLATGKLNQMDPYCPKNN